jgi:hypothetical protein
MPLFTEQSVRARARRALTTNQSFASVLNEHMEKQARVSVHDVFMSHAYEDREMVTGVTLKIEDLGYSVYLDWRDDPNLDRTKVTPATAEKLRERMKSSRCLFYSITPNAADSAWMKWELGYKDAHNSRVAVLPVVGSMTENYDGQQFLGLYPYVSDGADTGQKERLWIHRNEKRYIQFDSWLQGQEPVDH